MKPLVTFIAVFMMMLVVVSSKAQNSLINENDSKLDTSIYYEDRYRKPAKEKVTDEVLVYDTTGTKEPALEEEQNGEKERDYKYLKVWRPISIEPYKTLVWNAHTLERNTFIIRTRLLYRWAVGKYDGEGNYHSYNDSTMNKRFVGHLYAHYGLFDRLELGLHTGYATRTYRISETSTTEITHQGLLDTGIGARYMFLYDPKWIYLTLGADIIFPVGIDEFIGDDFRYRIGLMLTLPFKPFNIYADVHYTFRTVDDKFDYDDIMKAKVGIEYFALGNDISIILAAEGVWWGYSNSRLSEIGFGNSGFRMLSFSPAITYRPPNSNITLMVGSTHNFMGKDHQRYNRIFFDFQLGFGGIFSKDK